MADSVNKPLFNPLRAVTILTLALALLAFIWSLFNQHEVMCNVFGYRFKETPLFFVMLWSFGSGVLYMTVVWTLFAVKNWARIKVLKKKIEELNEKLNPPV